MDSGSNGMESAGSEGLSKKEGENEKDEKGRGGSEDRS